MRRRAVPRWRGLPPLQGRWGRPTRQGKLTPAQALEALRADGATPVLAHPGLLGLSRPSWSRWSAICATWAWRPSRSTIRAFPAQKDQYAALAGGWGSASGGSDYTARSSPACSWAGQGLPLRADSVLDRLREHRAKQGCGQNEPLRSMR
jgi:hypothetical protein